MRNFPRQAESLIQNTNLKERLLGGPETPSSVLSPLGKIFGKLVRLGKAMILLNRNLHSNNVGSWVSPSRRYPHCKNHY